MAVLISGVRQPRTVAEPLKVSHVTHINHPIGGVRQFDRLSDILEIKS